MSNLIQNAMRLALEKAKAFEGATAPNPPVGAAGLDIHGNILSVQAHEKAGTPHAEAKVIADCEQKCTIHQLHTIVVTLEPCNHTGKTPPCTEKILQSPIQRIIYGARDPNPHVQGRGAEFLTRAGLDVQQFAEFKGDCEQLIQPFAHWVTTGKPWITVKTAHRHSDSMIPPPGQKTFTSDSSLTFAHLLRKKADAILTGSGTLLADQPLFTVRNVPDHPHKKRWLVYMDRRGRIPTEQITRYENHGFLPLRGLDLIEIIQFLGKKGALEILVEAGPTLANTILNQNIWNTHVKITQQQDAPDCIEIKQNQSILK